MIPPLKYTSEQNENQSDDKKSCIKIFISQIFTYNSTYNLFDDFKTLIYDFTFF